MTRALFVALLLPLAAHADLVLSAGNTTLESTYNVGQILSGDTLTISLRLRNTTPLIPVLVTRYNVDQPAFKGNFHSTPFTVSSVPYEDTVSFSATVPGTYTANLRLNDRTIVLSGTVLPASLLTVLPSCPATPTRTVDFGIVVRGQARTCSFDVQNGAADVITLATLSVTGSGFTLTEGGPAPVTLNAGQTVTLRVRFLPAASGNFSGTMHLGILDYSLSGQGVNPALPTPILDSQATPAGSAQQRRLSARLPSPSPVTGSGTVRLAFIPGPALTDDPAIAFLNPLGRTVPFTVQEGSTDILLGGQPFAVFQTGTTAGQIQFTMTSALFTFESEPSAALTIPPAPVALDSAFGTRGAGELQVKLIGFDNTYTTGAMSFTFYGTAGGAITAPIPADFTQAFRTFYTSVQSGSMFQVIIRFPVTGNISAIAGVEVELTNSAGSLRTALLAF